MNELTSKDKLTLEDFYGFFDELHTKSSKKCEPYDWQVRLAEMAIGGQWPDFIDLPTGSGKTACLDVAVFALACQASLEVKDRTAPRRIFFCVNRRVIVGEAYERVRNIAEQIWNAELKPGDSKPVLARVAKALRCLSGIADQNVPPLDVLELRGGIYRDNRWARSMTQPTIICTTIDQLGSRLLFRGYGVSSGAAPIQAALIAYDSLVLLDEAHISRPFMQSLLQIRKYLDAEKWAEQSINVPPMTVVPMTATPPEGTDDNPNSPLQIESADRESTNLNSRLVCRKPAELRLVKDPNALVAEAVAKACEFAGGPSAAVGIIVNRVATAEDIYRQLREKIHAEKPDAVIELVIGSMRPVDRDEQAKRLRKLVGPERLDDTTASSFVVATQCLEVGADYDFNILITECASIDALQQRFGRLNRGGRHRDAQAVVLMNGKLNQDEAKLKDDKPADAIYGNALTRTWNWLWQHADVQTTEPDSDEVASTPSKKRKGKTKAKELRFVDFGIDAFDKFLEDHGERNRVPEAMLSPSSKLQAPVMLPAYVDLWAQTNPQPVPDPDVSLFIHGPYEPSRDVQVCWRSDLVEDEYMSKDDWCDVVSLLPPTAAECMTVPIERLNRWLVGDDNGGKDHGDLLSVPSPPPGNRKDDQKRKFRTPCVLWKGRSDSQLLEDADKLFPGCTVVLPANAQEWIKLTDPAESYVWAGLGHIPTPSTQDQQPTNPKASAAGEDDNTDSPKPSPKFQADIDVAEKAFRQAKDRSVLRIHPVIKAHFEEESAAQELLNRLADEESRPTGRELEKLAQSALLESEGLTDGQCDVRYEFYPDGRGLVVAACERQKNGAQWFLPSLDDGDDQSPHTLCKTPVSLADHTSHVVTETQATLSRVPLDSMRELYEVAAELHDWGKADERFQALLQRDVRSHVHDAAQVLAKSGGMPLTRREYKACRERAGMPEGFRHEMLSVQLAELSGQLPDDEQQREFVLHLIAAHHGYARPFAPFVRDDKPPLVRYRDMELTEDERMAVPLHRIDSGIAERFWNLTRRFGWWGLAYLEAVLRLSDQQASAKEDDEICQDTAPEENTAPEREEVSI